MLASSLLGFDTVAAVEIDPFCRSVIQARQNEGILSRFPIFEDVRTFDPDPWVGKVDLVTGGFPCQDISCAGNGEGINGPKSSLWWDMWRICCEVGAGFIFVENSPEIAARGLSGVLGALAARGWDAEWIVLGAGHIGAPHIRERLWLLGADSNVSARSQLRAQEPICEPDRSSSGEDRSGLVEFGRIVCDGGGKGTPSVGRVADGLAGPVDEGVFRLVADPDGSRLQERRKLQPAEAGLPERQPAWPPEPGVGRVVDGLAPVVDRRKRLKALGNGQVPRVAATAFAVLWDRLHQSS